ncbi:YadA-like family protein [Megasphaera sp.]|uniref:YadA-like family protein n=1 Tax=Megasphaera sp. TaxID=2023260 RepID=UPI00351F91C9
MSHSGGTEVDGDWDYIVNDSSWKGVVDASNYRNGYANLISNGKPKGFVRTTDAGSKLAWNATLSAYTYNGKVVDYSNIYVIDGEIGVFTNASGSEVYTGTVFGKNNEVLMTVKKSDGSYYSYWGAEVNDAGATMDTYRVAEYQKDLNVLRDNDFALYHNDIKSVDMSTNDSSATISLMRNGDGTTSPAVDGTLTLTNGGGTGGKDTYVRISNTTNGREVSKTFTTGSKVSAIGSTDATTGLTINGVDYTIKAGKDYKAGANIQISDDNTISATDTKYTAGANVNIDENNVISAVDTDTKYTAGKNITIDGNNVISAKEYTEGTNVSIDENNKISAKNTTLTNGPAEKSVDATSGGVTYTIKDTDGNAVTLEDVASATTVNHLIDGAKVHYFSVNASANEGNYNNDGAGNLSIAIGANTSATEEATAVGNNSTADERSAAFGYLSDARGTRAVAIGTEASTNGMNSTAIGQKAVAGYYKSDADQVQAEAATAVGSQAEVHANYGTAVGESAKVLSESGTALGMGAQIWENSANGVAVGRRASVGGNGNSAAYGIALGAESQAEAENGIAIGYDTVVLQSNSVALGSHATTNPIVATSSITIPNTNTTYNVNGTNPFGTVSVGSATGLRTITNVAAGRVSEASTDAVNGSELYAVATEAAKHTTITTEDGSRIKVDSQPNSAGGTEYILDVDTSDLANYSLTNLSQKGKTVITNLAKGVERHIKPDTYAVNDNGTVTMTYVDGNGTPVTGEAKITGIAKSDLSNITEEGDTYITKVANKAVKVIDGENTTVTPGKDGDVTTYAVNVDTNGKIEQNNTNIVTGDTVYNALQDVSWTAKVNGQVAKPVKKDDTLNFINGANIAISNENGDIKISTTGLASSGDLWTARVGTTDVRPVDKKVNFAGSDHITVTGSDGQITFATTGLADTNFTNITEEGNTYIRKLAKGEDVHIEAKEYAVNDDGSVTMTYVDGNGNTVDGTAKITGIAKSDLTNITEGGKTVINNLAKEAVKVVDGTNTKVREGTLDNGKIKTYAVDVKTDGTINKGDTNIVTGDTVYNALQNVSWKAQVNGRDAKIVAKDGTLNFVNGNNIAISAENGDIKISTTGLASSGDLWTAQAGGKDVKAVNQKVNFVGSDHITVTGSDGQITFATTGLADTNFTNITEEGNTYIKKLAKGEDVHIKADTYTVGNDGSVTMTYVDGNGKPVAGEATITGIAKSDLSNITNKGNTVINNIAKNAVKVIGGTNTAVETSTTDNGPVEYKVNLNKDVNLGDTIQLNGSDGSISAKSGGAKLSFGNNGLTVSQAKNGLTNETRINGAEITVDGGIGNQTTIKGSMARIGSVLVNGGSGTATITGLTNKTTNYTGFANGSGRAATEEQLKEVNSKATAAKTTVTNGKNITVNEAKADDGSSTYTVGLATDVVLGDNAIKLNGSDGSISAKSGGAKLSFNNNGLTVSQAKNGLTNETRINGAEIMVDGGIGNQTTIKGSMARIGSVLVNGGSGTATITGLTNKTTNYTGFANGSGRAATEEQLKEVNSKATAAKTTVTNGKNITVNEAKADDGSSTYTVGLETDVVLGDNAIKLNGSDGSISAKSGGAKLSFGNNGLTVSQAKNGLTNETRINGAEIMVDGGIGNQTTIKGSMARIGSVLVNGGSGTATITGLTNKTTNYTGFANGSGRAATEEQLKEVNSKATAAKTTVTNGKNITVNEAKANDGSSTYTVGLATDVVLGDNAIKLNGSDGSISAKSGGAQLAFNNSGLTVSQAKNGLTNETRIDGATITVDGGAGNQTIINGSTARIGSVLVNGGSGTATISGLTNQTTNYTGFANGSGRAATEEQLKEVAGKAGEAVETAGKGWNLTTNGKESSKTNIKPDGTVDFSSGNDNLVISNAGANLSFSLSDNLDLTNNKDKKGSVKVGENTALTDELLQVGKDVSLTASALNVGNSSLTTSALMVGGLTYINSSGINANSRVISNVAAGVLGTDAVNVDQLKSAISGSQVSIKAGDGISVAKTGNQYTINVNIEGVTNNQGKVTVSTGDSTSTESGSESGSSGAKKFKVMDLMYRAESNEVAPETTTETGKPMKIESIPEDIKLEADDNQAAHVVNGETIKIAGDGTNISTKANVTGAGSNKLDTISVSLKPDIRVDSVTINNGPTINSRGIDMNSQKITNLAEGDISETSTDAVNGSQLYNTNQAVIANAENINSLSHSLNKLDSRINRVGAGAAALAALHPLDFDPDNKWDFAAGYGNYAGANAVAIGTYYRPNENTMFSIGGSFGGGENMINAGVSFKLGQGGSGISTSKVAMAKKIKAQDELLKAQDAKMKEQDEKIAKLEALVAQQGEMIKQALNK